MAKINLFLCLFFVFLRLPVFSFGENPEPPVEERVLEDVRFFSTLFPRQEGMKSERAMIDFIETSLRRMDVRYVKHSLGGSEGFHSFSSVVEADIPGEKDDTVILAVPINHADDSGPGNDYSVNSALALGIVEELRATRPAVSVKILFLGAEWGDTGEYPIGSRYVLETSFTDKPVCVLYLAMQKIPSRLLIRSGGAGVVAPLWLIERVGSALRESGMSFLVRGNETQISRIVFSSPHPFISPYLSAGYPALSFEGEYEEGIRGAADDGVWVKDFLNFFQIFVQKNKGGFPAEWDKHYLFFQTYDFFLAIGENIYILLIVLVFVFLFADILIQTKQLRRSALELLKYSWLLFALFVTACVLFILSTFLLETVLSVKKMPDLWKSIPMLFFVLKLMPLVLFSFFASFLLEKKKIRLNERFFANSTLLFLGISTIAISFYDITFVYYFVWAFFFTALSRSIPFRPIQVLCILIAPFWLLKAAYDVFTLPAFELVNILLFSRVYGNVFLALVFFPFLLSLTRIRFILRIRNRTVRCVLSAVTFGLCGLLVAGLSVYVMQYSPYSPFSVQPVNVRETIDENEHTSRLEITSPAYLGSITVREAGVPDLDIRTNLTTYSVERDYVTSYIGASVAAKPFLDRKVVSLSIDPAGQPYFAEIVLFSKQEIIIYDADFPFSVFPREKKARIYVGRNPTFPLKVNFTIPKQGETFLSVTLHYKVMPHTLEIAGKDVLLSYRLSVKKEMNL